VRKFKSAERAQAQAKKVNEINNYFTLPSTNRHQGPFKSGQLPLSFQLAQDPQQPLLFSL
jgi:hypothetical protein